MNGSVRKLIRKQKQAHKAAKRLNSEECWAIYRALRNRSVNAIKNAKKESKENLANKINANNISNRDWWKKFKSLLCKGKYDTIPPLNYTNTSISLTSFAITVHNFAMRLTTCYASRHLLANVYCFFLLFFFYYGRYCFQRFGVSIILKKIGVSFGFPTCKDKMLYSLDLASYC